MSINYIDSRIEQRNTGKGQSAAMLHMGRPLNNRQQKILKALPEYDSKVVISKKAVNMKDLAAITAETGDEFAMFTKGSERLVVRGNKNSVNIDVSKAKELSAQGYKWSGHTHPGTDIFCLQYSEGDMSVLMEFNQKHAAIYNSKRQFDVFKKRGE